jgi:hypothetical protein
MKHIGSWILRVVALCLCAHLIHAQEEDHLRIEKASLRAAYWDPYDFDSQTLELHHLDEAVFGAPDTGFSLAERSIDLPNLSDGLEKELADLTDSKPKTVNLFYSPPDLAGQVERIKEGKFFGGIRFTGTNGVLAIGIGPGNPHTSRDRTIECWINADSLPEKDCTLIACFASPLGGVWNIYHSKSVRLLLLSDGALQLRCATDIVAQTSPLIRTGQWHHVALQWSLRKVQCQVDGQVEAVAIGDRIPPSVNCWRLDTAYLGNSNTRDSGFRGRMDEVRCSKCEWTYYPNNLGWEDTEGRLNRSDAPPFFRSTNDLVLHLDFNGQLEPAKAPAGVTPVLPGGTASKAVKPSGPPPFLSAVERQGGIVGINGMQAVYEGAHLFPSNRGTVALWLRPLNWNNDVRWEPDTKPLPTKVPIFQVTQGGKSIASLELWKEPSAKLYDVVPFYPGQWNHLVFTWEGRFQRTYVNGEEWLTGGSWVWQRISPTSGVPERLSFDHACSSRTLVDDFRLFNRALAPVEIRNLAGLYDRREEMTALQSANIVASCNGLFGRLSATIYPFENESRPIESVILSLQKQGTTSPLSQTTKALDGETFVSMAITNLPSLAFGDYVIRADLCDAKGTVLGCSTQIYHFIQPPWLDNTLGVTNAVMPDWIPVIAQGRTVSVIGRDASLSAGGLPEKVVSAGKDVLAAPIRLDASLAGAPLPFVPEPDGPRFSTNGETEVHWKARSHAGPLSLDVNARMEFDGMMWFTMTLKSEAQKQDAGGASLPALDSLQVRIPYDADSAIMTHWWSGNEWFRNTRSVWIGAVSTNEGLILSSLDRKRVGLYPGQVGSFMPYVMLTGDKRGMAWFAENDKGWTQSTNVPAVSVERHGNVVTLVLNVISEGVDLHEPRTFAFGLHPIPVKPLRKGWRRVNGWGVTIPGFNNTALMGQKNHLEKRDYPVDGDLDAILKQCGRCGAIRPKDQTNVSQKGRAIPPWEESPRGIYLNLRGITPYKPLAADWYPLWRGTAWGGYDTLRYLPTLIQYRVWTWNEYIRRDLIGGAYFDDCWPNPQRIVPGTCAYLLPDGKMQPGYSFLGEREFFKRIRQVCVDQDVFPHLCAHTTHTLYIPYHSFFDVLLDGEDHYRAPPSRVDFMDCWSLPRLRFHNAAKWGITTSWLSWHGLLKTSAPPEMPDWGYRQARAFTATMLLHDLIWNKHQRFVDTTLDYKTMDGLKLMIDSDTEFVPYWEPNGLASWEPAQSVKVSAWKRQGLCAVVVVNHGTNNVDARMQLSPKAMGFDSVEPETLAIRDVDPSLLRTFEAYVPPPSGTTNILEMPLIDIDDTPDMESLLAQADADVEAAKPEEQRRAENPDAAFEWKDGILTCRVRRHDYRFFAFTPK